MVADERLEEAQGAEELSIVPFPMSCQYYLLNIRSSLETKDTLQNSSQASVCAEGDIYLLFSPRWAFLHSQTPRSNPFTS
jgi:hypothetical protein